jgi:hypothetical protein
MARTRPRKHKCLCCKSWFVPDPRKRGRQKYCSKKPCQQASKAASQRRWLCKAQNEHYFQGPEQVDRVQRWRRAHPQYWRKKRFSRSPALQDLIDTQPIEATGKFVILNEALQDVMAERPGRQLQLPMDHNGLRAGVERVDQTGCR